jgi:putative radical SAM enzyme (TIGR03279 family)
MPYPSVLRVSSGSPAERAGVVAGDALVAVNGVPPRDIIDYQQLVDGPDPLVTIQRAGLEIELPVDKPAGTLVGMEISDALFDKVRTCDNHCEFCFIYQLPKGLRRTLYVKDDDYRLSFLYGNFTTLTRFTEADFERVITERLSPLYVSIHTTDPLLRAEMLRNRRGATSLRWLEHLLEAGVTVHGQIVLAPAINDGDRLRATLTDILLRFPKLASVGVVPLGVSKYTKEPRMRPMTKEEAREAIATVEEFSDVAQAMLGKTMVYCSDEFYLLGEMEFPPYSTYADFEQLENGVGVTRAFEREFALRERTQSAGHSGFFSSIDGAPALGYRAVRFRPKGFGQRRSAGAVSVAIVTSTYGKLALGRVFESKGQSPVDVIEVTNEFFGGNIAVTGLMSGQDVARAIATTDYDRLLLPDVCLSEGRFIDGLDARELPREVEVVPTDGASLAAALQGTAFPLIGGTRG